MTKIMMVIGFYPFMLDTATYDTLKRRATWRWQAQDRIGRKPAQQFLGSGAQEITLQGEIMPHWKGGQNQVAAMRLQADLGAPLMLIEGYGGFVLGRWVITAIDETKTELAANGAPHVIQFTMTLREYGDDWGLSGLFGAVARLL